MNEQNKKRTILIVDDVSDNIQVVAHHLGGKGYELLFATDGLSALDTLSHGPVDLVLLDVMMPQMDGFETCRRMKQDPQLKDTPVIFLTAKTDTNSVMQGFEVGGVDYVAKPFIADELLARVSTHLKLREREQQLRMLIAARDRFLSVITNQLETPFNGLKGILQKLVHSLDELPPNELREFVEYAESAALSISELLANLTSWARMNSNQYWLAPTTVDPSQMLREIMDLHQLDTTAKDLSFDAELETDLTVEADPELLEVVFENLVSNALKYSHSGGVVEVKTHREDDTLEITIRDHGDGISEQELSAIFDLDQQLLRSGTAGESGSGLGLFLCRELLNRSGGALKLANCSDGSGLEARVLLPARIAGA